MKIIFDKNKPIIECSYDEGIKILKEFLLDKKVEKRGKYKHKSKVSNEKRELIKKIFEEYPNRSERSIAKELNLTRDQVRYWREHGQT